MENILSGQNIPHHSLIFQLHSGKANIFFVMKIHLRKTWFGMDTIFMTLLSFGHPILVTIQNLVYLNNRAFGPFSMQYVFTFMDFFSAILLNLVFNNTVYIKK